METDSTASKPKLHKVERLRVFEHAVEQIRELILQGAFGPGEKLPTELELSKQLNIGRSSIREALRVLEAEGLIKVRRGAGAYVAPEGGQMRARIEVARWLVEREETLGQLLQVRESIEGLTAALAASRASTLALVELKEIVERQSAIAEESAVHREEHVDEMANLDARFHMTISALSGNDIADEIVLHVLPAFTESNKAVLYVGGRAERLVQEHRLVLAAIEAGNPDEAERAMRSHIARVRGEIHGLKASAGS